jgi:hypothetical protein
MMALVSQPLLERTSIIRHDTTATPLQSAFSESQHGGQ